MSRWFICVEENVQGPFSGEELKAMKAGGHLADSTMVWGRPHNTWMAFSRWVESAPTLVSASPEVKTQQAQLWHYAINGTSVGPLTRAELVNELKSVSAKDQILVWTKGMKSWSDLFEFHDLLDEIGLNKREQPRAQLAGGAVIRYDNKTLIGQVKTISPGGVGITQVNSQLPIGQLVSIEIKSDELGQPINVKAVVQYVTDAGFYGFKWQSISMEAKSQIIDYIKRTKKPSEQAA